MVGSMNLSKTELAVLNNVHWYEAVFAAHELGFERTGLAWFSHDTPPPYHSNLVVLSKGATQSQVEELVRQVSASAGSRGWSMKDSYANLDLAPLGFSELFEATWIWSDPVDTGVGNSTAGLTWSRMTSPRDLAEWEAAWAGDSKNQFASEVRRQFPDQMLLDHRYAFLAGKAQGKIVAGGILNQSPGAVGVSNTFADHGHIEDLWRSLVQHAGSEFPGIPLVGYERGTELQLAQTAGFQSIGALRVWCHGG